jgi:DsbC/DsbD-like thiol-disulfide interchange protein
MFQRLHLTIELAIVPGLHVYASPVPAGYTPLSVEIAPIDGLEVGSVRWPGPRRHRVPGLADEFWVHEGTIRGALALTCTAPAGSGDHVVRVTVRYQACDERVCYPPAAAALDVPVQEVALVDRTLPAPRG